MTRQPLGESVFLLQVTLGGWNETSSHPGDGREIVSFRGHGEYENPRPEQRFVGVPIGAGRGLPKEVGDVRHEWSRC
jgi:hypothetical protein